MTTYDELTKRWDAVMLATYATPPLALKRGEGCRVWDVEDNCYLDLIAGIAVCALGHAHPAICDAVSRQLATLGHVSNLYLTAPAVTLAERLLGLLDVDGRVFFCNSGAEAAEAALKVARKRGGSKRTGIVAAEGGFHGRTIGALSVTGQPAKRAPFEPLLADVTFVPPGDIAALTAAVSDETAAVFLEPMLGEGGVVPLPDGYLFAAREITRRYGALLVLDEVQTGLGRTGSWFAHQTAGLLGANAPDVVTLAKGLGGGLPIGACIAIGSAAEVLTKGDHGSTFGGNPVVCAAALAVLDTIESERLLENARVIGDRLAAGVFAHVDGPLTGVRGAGLLRALTFDTPLAAAFEVAARSRGFLVNAVAPDAVRLAPPLILSAREADEFADSIPRILATVQEAI